MAGGGAGVVSTPTGVFEARLDTSIGTGNTLTLGQYKGKRVEVRGQVVTIPGAGLTRDVADNTITAAGADSGAPPAADTMHYVYISNSRASFSPSSIRLSTQIWTLVNGIRYLGAAGNALNWRFVGWVRPNATPQFTSTLVRRWIINYYNRQSLDMFTCPGYVNDGLITAWTAVNNNWLPANGGVGYLLEFLANGEDNVSFRARASYSTDTAGAGVNMGVGVDGNAPLVQDVSDADVNQAAIGIIIPMMCPYDKLFPEGVHNAGLWVVVGAGTATFYADWLRQGAVQDPAVTYIEGFVPG